MPDGSSSPPEPAVVPPHSQASETALLRSALLVPSTLESLREALTPEHFYFDAHARIFEALLAAGPDAEQVANELRRTERYYRVGGAVALADLMLSDPADDIGAHVEVVREAYRARRLIRVLQQVTGEMYGGLGADEAWRRVREVAA